MAALKAEQGEAVSSHSGRSAISSPRWIIWRPPIWRSAPEHLRTEVEDLKLETPLFWSTFGQRHRGTVRRPMEGKNIRRLIADR